MTIIKWDPFGNVASLQSRINRMFEEAFAHPESRHEDMATGTWKPLVDIYQEGDGIVIKVELPGVKKENISVDVKDNTLVLRGTRLPESDIPDNRYYRRERIFGPFYRAFTLQEYVAPESIQAAFKDGVLEVRIPKPEEQKPTQVTVSIE
ncbi:MAG: Hsp20/alpha crystallin family protein [Thermodesulfobacteriota bacterium]